MGEGVSKKSYILFYVRPLTTYTNYKVSHFFFQYSVISWLKKSRKEKLNRIKLSSSGDLDTEVTFNEATLAAWNKAAVAAPVGHL